MEKSILEMVGGERHIKPHYDIKIIALENAKLKERLEEHERVGNAQFWKNVWSWKAKVEQLAKAKEHIENLLYYVKQCSCERSNYAELEHDIAEAEQFLKEVKE